MSAYETYDEPTGTSGGGNVGHGRAGYRLGLVGPGNPRAGQSVPDDSHIPSNVAIVAAIETTKVKSEVLYTRKFSFYRSF